jgi:DNA-directed RNA polymerase subunit RPC12/RpoP
MSGADELNKLFEGGRQIVASTPPETLEIVKKILPAELPRIIVTPDGDTFFQKMSPCVNPQSNLIPSNEHIEALIESNKDLSVFIANHMIAIDHISRFDSKPYILIKKFIDFLFRNCKEVVIEYITATPEAWFYQILLETAVTNYLTKVGGKTWGKDFRTSKAKAYDFSIEASNIVDENNSEKIRRKADRLLEKLQMQPENYFQDITSLSSLLNIAFLLKDENIHEAQSFLKDYFAWIHSMALENYQLQGTRLYDTQCLYCGNHFFWDSTRRNPPASCKDCKYRNISKVRKQREEKNGPKLISAEWIKFGDKKSCCVDCRVSRWVNSEKMCSRCFYRKNRSLSS